MVKFLANLINGQGSISAVFKFFILFLIFTKVKVVEAFIVALA